MSQSICTVYKVTNKTNGKIYIGRTRVDPKTRWNRHVNESKGNSKRLFMNALRKYGRDGFDWEVFYQSFDEDHIKDIEEATIARFDSTNLDKGYNRTYGGFNEAPVEPATGEKNGMYGKSHTYEARKAVSIANKGKLAGENNPIYGKPRPKYVLDAISKAQKGRVWVKIKCPHCLKSGATHNMKRYHFDNCRQNPYLTDVKKAELDERDRVQSEKLCAAKQKFKEEGRKLKKRQKFHVTRTHKICPHCFLEGSGPNMTRYHFDKCKLKEAK